MRPITVHSCDASTNRLSKTEYCAEFDLCKDIFTRNDEQLITDNQWNVCPQVVADTRVYKADLPPSVDTVW